MTAKGKRLFLLFGVALGALVATTVLYSQTNLPARQITVYKSPG